MPSIDERRLRWDTFAWTCNPPIYKVRLIYRPEYGPHIVIEGGEVRGPAARNAERKRLRKLLQERLT